MLFLSNAALALLNNAPKIVERAGADALRRPALAAAPIAASLVSLPNAALAFATLENSKEPEFDLVDAIINAGLSIIVLAFLAFIGNYFLQAAVAVGEGAQAIADAGILESEKPTYEKGETVYDDSGSGGKTDAQIREELAARAARGPGSKQQNSGGRAFAPWMDIDEEAVERNKAERKLRKAAEAGGGDLGGGLPEMPKMPKMPWEQ